MPKCPKCDKEVYFGKIFLILLIDTLIVKLKLYVYSFEQKS